MTFTTSDFEADAASGIDAVRATVVSIAAGKGGVGKTTSCASIAASLSFLGYRVLLIDLDPQSHARHLFGIRAGNTPEERRIAPEPNLAHVLAGQVDAGDAVYESANGESVWVLPASLLMLDPELTLAVASDSALLTHQIEPLLTCGNFDICLLDNAPGASAYTLAGFGLADAIVLAAGVGSLTTDGALDTYDLIAAQGGGAERLVVGAILTSVDKQTVRLLARRDNADVTVKTELAARGVPILGEIPYAPHMEGCYAEGRVPHHSDRRSAVADAYFAAAQNLVAALSRAVRI